MFLRPQKGGEIGLVKTFSMDIQAPTKAKDVAFGSFSITFE